MAPLLQEAYERIARLSEEEQEHVAALILAELDDEARWDASFAASGDLLDRMADEALAEHRAGRTKPLDPDASWPRVPPLKERATHLKDGLRP